MQVLIHRFSKSIPSARSCLRRICKCLFGKAVDTLLASNPKKAPEFKHVPGVVHWWSCVHFVWWTAVHRVYRCARHNVLSQWKCSPQWPWLKTDDCFRCYIHRLLPSIQPTCLSTLYLVPNLATAISSNTAAKCTTPFNHQWTWHPSHCTAIQRGNTGKVSHPVDPVCGAKWSGVPSTFEIRGGGEPENFWC